MKKFFLLLILPLFLCATTLKNGEVEIIKLDEKSRVVFNGKNMPVLKNPINKDKYYVLLPVKYRQKAGDYKLLIDGKKTTLHVEHKNYKKEYIKVAKSKVKPDKKVLKTIQKEYKDAMKIYGAFTPKRYWDKPFILPLKSKITSDYGNARMFNGTLRSFHSGTDFRAKMRTPIRASNDGVVVIASKRYFAGGSVVIDHGQGVYSCYFHLSKILVKVGQKVKQKQIIGLSGKSGRVNGPHLHFGIRVYAYALDPLQFITQINQLFKGDQ